MSPGISCSARRISLRPNSASARSFTLYGTRPALAAVSNGCVSTAVGIFTPSRRASGRRDEERRTFRVWVDWQRDETDVLEAGTSEQPSQLVLAEAQPDVPHLFLILLAVVRQHVAQDDSSSRLQRACRLTEHCGGIGHVVQHEEHDRRVELAVFDRQR